MFNGTYELIVSRDPTTNSETMNPEFFNVACFGLVKLDFSTKKRELLYIFLSLDLSLTFFAKNHFNQIKTNNEETCESYIFII